MKKLGIYIHIPFCKKKCHYCDFISFSGKQELIEQYNIRYIVVDFECRTSSEYVVREDIIEQAYEAVFEHDTGDWQVRIFDTQKYIAQ